MNPSSGTSFLPKPAATNDGMDPLAALALMNDWVTDEQVAEAERLCKKFAEEGIKMSVGEALEKKGYLNKLQVDELTRRSKAAQMAQAIPGYELIKKLGQGGMGSVYKAIQKVADRKVAIKILSPARAKVPNFVDRFVREARASARVNHPHIIQGIDVGQANGIHYFVMEYVEGGTLREKLKQRGRLTEAETLHVAIQMAGALDAINKAGMVHRDIKPENILCCPDGSMKLCDLGLSRLMDEDSSLTQSDVALGTPLYISPEQAQAKNNFDSRTDMYGLGSTLYHLLTGRPPFSGETSTAVMTAHVLEEAVHPRLLTPDASAGFVAVLRMMMAKQMKDRYPNPGALIQDLENLRKGRAPEIALKFSGKSSIPSVSGGTFNMPAAPASKAPSQEPILPPLDSSSQPRPSARSGSAIRPREHSRPPTPPGYTSLPPVPLVTAASAPARLGNPEPITIDTPLNQPVVKYKPPTNPAVAPVMAPVIALGPIPPRVIGSASKDRAVSNPQAPTPNPSNPQLPTTGTPAHGQPPLPSSQPAATNGYGRMMSPPPAAGPSSNAPVEQYLPPAAFAGMSQGIVGASAMGAPMPAPGSAPRPQTQASIPPQPSGAPAPAPMPKQPAPMDDQLNALLQTKVSGFPVIQPPPPPPETRPQVPQRPVPVDDQLNALLSTKTSGFPTMPPPQTVPVPLPVPANMAPAQNANAVVAPAARSTPTATPDVIIPTPLPGTVPAATAPVPQPAPKPAPLFVPPPPPANAAPVQPAAVQISIPTASQAAQPAVQAPPPAQQPPLFVPPPPAGAPTSAQPPLFTPPPPASGNVGLNLSDLSAEPAPAAEGGVSSTSDTDVKLKPVKKGSNRTIIIAIAAILFLGLTVVAVGGYFGYQYWKKRQAGNTTAVANLNQTDAPPKTTPPTSTDVKIPELPNVPPDLNKGTDEARALAEKKAAEAKQAALDAQKKLEEEKAAAEKKLLDDKAAAEQKAKDDAAKLAEEKKAREAEMMAKLEADRKAEAARLVKEKEAAEAKAKEEAEKLAKLEEEKKAELERLAKAEADKKAEAERLAKEDADRKAKEAADLLAKQEAEKKNTVVAQNNEPVPPASTQAAVEASKTEPKTIEVKTAPATTETAPKTVETAPATTTTTTAPANVTPPEAPIQNDSKEAAFQRALEQAGNLLNGETPDAKGVYTMLTPDKQKQVMAEILKAWQIKPNHPSAREMWLKLGWRKWDGTEKVADYAKAVRLPPTISLDAGDGVMLEANLIPAAMFTMGSAEGETGHVAGENQHLVHISKPFYMAKYEITQEVYEKVMGAAANKSAFKGPKNPEDRVSWLDAEAFCKALSAKIKKPVRLPTESEWEFACRAGTTTLFNFGDVLTADKANFYGKSPVGGEKGEYRGKSVPVGTFQPNAFGLFDMHGNSWEWVSDWRADYPVDPVVDPQGPEKGKIKVMRGGSWYSKGLSCRSANRDGDNPTDAGTHYGFRVAIDLSK